MPPRCSSTRPTRAPCRRRRNSSTRTSRRTSSRPPTCRRTPCRGAGGYKSSSMQATPVYNSPNESPSHPSYGRHSRASSVSRFSGILRGGSGRKGGGDLKSVNAKG
ncbi:hypothetical protein D1007_33659 [Hordeum vulgare]|nr:hypothetical protein D1007_33659 [Hordeum vulgare]